MYQEQAGGLVAYEHALAYLEHRAGVDAHPVSQAKLPQGCYLCLFELELGRALLHQLSQLGEFVELVGHDENAIRSTLHCLEEELRLLRGSREHQELGSGPLGVDYQVLERHHLPVLRKDDNGLALLGHLLCADLVRFAPDLDQRGDCLSVLLDVLPVEDECSEPAQAGEVEVALLATYGVETVL